ncbi:hypothetical protein M8312_13310 [Sphingomonas sp. KRR8]|uniref:hypothetical protein n=1 Tax=Sphingomonas sp. KRR8 TaxID=2942996 RepID=UPI002020B707|nr:hypothetical protein [Sphingomonas sp. KRR8]URD60736.1 hypothetical protein M8312_13310 [Sphingomonas sp. KRR8]
MRLDLIRATSHDKHILQDYDVLAKLGLKTIRDGLRWHLIGRTPGRYDWSSWLPGLEAAERLGLQIIWDLFHYGSPDHLDQGAPDFPDRFADFAVAAMRVHRSVSSRPACICLLNEINFMAWAVSEGYFPPVGTMEHGWFKSHLVRAAIAASTAIKQDWPDTIIIGAEPLIHIAPHNRRRQTVRKAKQNLQGMYEAYDWLLGVARPELGGSADLIDVIGWNFYPHNQWYFEGPTIPMGHHEYRALSHMLIEMASRYRKPMMLSETGAEGTGKASWLHYVSHEVRDAMVGGADMRGICWYPITAYPGWDNSRYAETGLLSTILANGTRNIDARLLGELQMQQMLFACEPDRRPKVAGGGRH